MSGGNECITVVVRCRPLNRKENDENRKSIIDVDLPGRQVAILNPDTQENKSFTFDATYDENTQQRIFYEESCFSIVDSTLEGFNSTIFAYGQTGCGKSFTMQGPSTTDDEMKGVIPNSFSHIFQFVKSTPNVEFLLRCSYLELYNEEIRDLLGNPKTAVKCDLRESPDKGVYVEGITHVVVESAEDLNKMLDKGLSNRTTASTLMNSESSRSHSIFSITIEMNTNADGKDMLRVGKLNLVDLAGSERAKKTGAKGATLQEGIKINLSLSVLGNVISALAEGGRHIPYRDSKLTRLLQDSLGGNTKTMMVAAISPADYNYEETLSTLRYANRAKNIKNKPKINEDPKDAMIRALKAEIENFKQLLANGGGMGMQMQMQWQEPVKQAPRASPQKRIAAAAEVEDEAADYEAENLQSRQGQAQVQATQTVPRQQPKQQTPEKAAPNKAQEQAQARQLQQKQQAQQVAEMEEEYEEAFEVPSPAHSHPSAAVLDHHQQHQPHQQQQQEDDEQHYYEDVAAEEEPISMQQQQQMIVDRIHQMENMLVNHYETAVQDASSLVKEPSVKVKTSAELQEEEVAGRAYRERKNQAKKKQQEQKAALARVVEEKRMMEDELEELRGAVADKGPAAASDAGLEEAWAKKVAKMKRKQEKRLEAMREEMEDMRDEFSYQRKLLLDGMIEQEKDAKLYELICKAVLTDKDLNKIIEKCRYDEDRDEWVIPFAKKKNLDNMNFEMAPMSPMPGMNGTAAPSKPKNSSLLLPDINASQQPRGMEMNQLHAMPQMPRLVDPNMRLVSSPLPSARSRPISKAGQSREVSAAVSPVATPPRLAVPMLTLPGSLTLSTTADVMQDRLPAVEDGIAYKKKKKKAKDIQAFPPINHSALPTVMAAPVPVPAAAEDGVGAVENWDWNHSSMPPINNKSSQPEAEYSDDEDFVDESKHGKKKKKKTKRREVEGGGGSNSARGGGGGLPPIDNKYSTPRTTLPPI